MSKDRHLEWLNQSDYDFSTARYMYEGGRHIYEVYMCHLSLEKALKGLISKNLNAVPPKTHNLLYLVEKLTLKPEKWLIEFISEINSASVVTRYPDDLIKLQSVFN